VWNEPNLDFWAGEPKQSTYWTLYDHTGQESQAVDARLRVGGPATAQGRMGFRAFIQHCKQDHVPVDFISTHVYGDDTARTYSGSTEPIARDRGVSRRTEGAFLKSRHPCCPSLPLIWSEFNASFANTRKSPTPPTWGRAGGGGAACDGLVQDMSYWTFSDVFEGGRVL